MTRIVGLVSLLAALAVCGWLVTSQMRSAGVTESGGITATQIAADTASAASLAQAALALETAKATAGTYAGAVVPVAGVSLARADAEAYCLQTAGLHLVGPGGAPAPGPC
jgi:hypothetical protein